MRNKNPQFKMKKKFTKNSEESETTLATINYLNVLGLSTNLHHPGMGVEDMPGLAESPPMEKLDAESMKEVANKMVEEKIEINFIRGFVGTHDEMHGNKVKH